MADTKKRVLLIDDEEIFTRVLKLNLEQTGRFDVRVENWAAAALQAAKEFNPDVVLLDVIMPQMFGGDIAAQLRSDPSTSRAQIIFLSASLTRSTVREHEGVIGGYRFLAKPASLEEVIRAIESDAP